MELKKSKAIYCVMLIILGSLSMSSNVRGEVRSDEVSPQWDLCCGPCDKYEYLYLYSEISSTEHEVFKEVTAVCQRCGSRYTFDPVIYTEAHQFSSYIDKGHTGVRHIWERSCIDCSYSQSISIICQGPPCSTPVLYKDDLIK